MLDQAIASGDRVVLLVTGHERRGEPPVLRGRIRAAVHDWLAASRHAASIAAVRAAQNGFLRYYTALIVLGIVAVSVYFLANT